MADTGKKRKSVSKGSASQARNSDYNTDMFRSFGCEKFYESIPKNVRFIREKPIVLAPGEFQEMQENIRNRGWEQFVSHPKSASKDLILEFFSNIFPKTVDGSLRFPVSTSYVRGHNVPFDHGTINDLFGLAPVEVQDCLLGTKLAKQRVKGNLQLAAEIRDALCKPGKDWERGTGGVHQNILNSSLTPVARGWADFVCHTICPTSNHSEVSLERAVLTSCIVRGEPVNLGWVMEHEINAFAKFKKDALPKFWRYAGLVALLCERAGVVAGAEEETVPPGNAITGSWIRSVAKIEHPVLREEQMPQQEEPQQEEPDDLGPTIGLDDIPIGPSLADFQELQARMDAMVANQELMAANQQQMMIMQQQMMANQEQMRVSIERVMANQEWERRFQERMCGENRFGTRALYRALAEQSGGQLDPQVDIFQPLRPPQPPQRPHQ